MAKEMTTNAGGFRFVWRLNRPGREVHVDAIDTQGRKVLEWAFPMVPGGGGLLGHVAIWRDQALLYAQNPPS